MEIIDYIDFKQLFNDVKESHLSKFPTVEKFQEYLKENQEEAQLNNFVLLYNFLENNSVEYMEQDSSSSVDDFILKDIFKGRFITVTFAIGENDSNESTNYNYWGYEYIFKIDLKEGIFIEYKEGSI